MWFNDELTIDAAISAYRKSLLGSCPNHIVIDGLFDEAKLNEVLNVLQQPQQWLTQKHTYSALYVDDLQWQKTSKKQRFVQRNVWQRKAVDAKPDNADTALNFLSFLRSDEFLAVLSRIFNVSLTDLNVAEPEINTNYFRLSAADFIGQHADDSPGREVCMLLYLNQDWPTDAGGELAFLARDNKTIRIAPAFNRCVLFDPFSKGSEHWVEKLNPLYTNIYRYNVTSWYWSE